MKSESKIRWEFLKDKKGMWIWRRVDGSGKVIQKSKDSFVTRGECIHDAIWKGYTP